MYLFIDEQYRIYKAPILSGKNRLLVKQGKLSSVNLSTMQGMNIDGTFSGIQEMPANFEPDSPSNISYEEIGWCHAFCCAALDEGKDPRQIDCAEIIEKAKLQLGA